MKRISVMLGLVAAVVAAAPLAAQSRNDGIWMDVANALGRLDILDSRAYGGIYDDRARYSRRIDGRWHRDGRDRSGRLVYERLRYDRRGNVVYERAYRDRLGRYRVVHSRIVQQGRRGHDRWEVSRRGNDRGKYDVHDRRDRRRR